MKLSNMLVASIVFFSGLLCAQIELPEDKVKWTFQVEQNGAEATVIVNVKCVDHWHINAVKLPKGSFGFPTSFTLKNSKNFQMIGGTIEPKPIEKYDELSDEQLAYHEGSFKLKQKIKVLSSQDFTLEGTFSFQTCNEVKCLPDHAVNFKLNIKGVNSDQIDIDQLKIKSEFVRIMDDEAVHKDGTLYVLVDGIWYAVPKGNSVGFYKKYLSIIKRDEE